MTLLAIVMGRGGPSQELHPCRPPASLLALPVLGSIFLHTCMIVAGQLGALFMTMSQEWWAARGSSSLDPKGSNYDGWIFFYSRYIPLNSTMTGAENLPNMENSSVFLLSGFQYIIMAVVVTKSYPHKKPLYYNCRWTRNCAEMKLCQRNFLQVFVFFIRLQGFSSVWCCCSSLWWPGWWFILESMLLKRFNFTTSMMCSSKSFLLLWLHSTSSCVLSLRWVATLR